MGYRTDAWRVVGIVESIQRFSFDMCACPLNATFNFHKLLRVFTSYWIDFYIIYPNLGDGKSGYSPPFPNKSVREVLIPLTDISHEFHRKIV